MPNVNQIYAWLNGAGELRTSPRTKVDVTRGQLAEAAKTYDIQVGLWAGEQLMQWAQFDVKALATPSINSATADAYLLSDRFEVKFLGTVVDGEVVQIGPNVYEFDDDGNVADGAFAVNIVGANTADKVVDALLAAVSTNTLERFAGIKTAVATAEVRGPVRGAVSTDADAEVRAVSSMRDGVATFKAHVKKGVYLATDQLAVSFSNVATPDGRTLVASNHVLDIQ